VSGSTEEHRRAARGDEGTRAIACAVLTVSDTRTLETDRGGALIVELLGRAGHSVVERGVVRDDPEAIGAWLDARIADPRVQVVLTTGGTGVAKRDSTIDVARARFTAEMEGFGELFRMLSFEEIGPAAMLSRAAAGFVSRGERRTLVFCMPGSPNAVETAMSRLIAPELSHLVWETRR